MRTSMIGAALLLAGAGAAGLAAAAVDTNGNGLAVNGSDALFDVTTSVISICNGQSFNTDNTGGDTYLGGGTNVGTWQMSGGTSAVAVQAISPMSRALQNSEFCALTTTVYGGTVPESSGATEGLLVGIDGVSIVASQTTTCANSTTNSPPVVGANGLGASTAMSIQAGGTGTPTGATYTFGDQAGSLYKNQPSFDALAVLYFGLTHDGQYDCGSDTRRTLIRNWKNLFSTDCSAGDAACAAGLTHAWRHGDLSGTTDAFVSILNPPDGTTGNGKGAAVSVGIGTLRTLRVSDTQKSNPFCNSGDANTIPAPVSYGGSSDFSDRDPVRTACGAAGADDNVCEAYKNSGAVGNFLGDLGVVLPILLPDSPVTVTSDLYPTVPCGTACTLVAPGKNIALADIRCPGSGTLPNQGYCLMPVIDATSNDPRCISNSHTHCFDVVGKPDGRQYNLPVLIAYSQLTGTYQKYKFPGVSYQWAIDVNGRPMDRSFYRIHAQTAAANNVPDPAAGTTGICRENDATSQIGCLADSDPCSLGYAGRESAKAYPGLGTPAIPTSEPLKALAVNGTMPFTPDAVAIAAIGIPDPDLALKNLLAPSGTTPVYPFARRLYFNTIFGFSNLQGGEKELAECYATNSIVGPAMASHGFVAIPSGVQCLDYPEGQGTSSPAPNVQGSGNVALGGCGASGGDACTNFPLTDINGVTVPEATETFGP